MNKVEWDMTNLDDLKELRNLEIQQHERHVKLDGGATSWTRQNHQKRLRKLDRAIRKLENAK